MPVIVPSRFSMRSSCCSTSRMLLRYSSKIARSGAPSVLLSRWVSALTESSRLCLSLSRAERRAGADVHRLAPGGGHVADRNKLRPEAFERRHHRLEREAGARGLGMPGVRIDSAGEVHGPEPERGTGSSSRLRCQRGCHRIEHRQRDRGAKGTTQESAAGQVLLRDDHMVYSTVARATVLPG